jgi:hypothetical protein
MAMKRREMLGLLGGAAIGATGLPQAAEAGEDHASAPRPSHDDGPVDPAKAFHLYLCAFHIAKKDPSIYVEAHHYCSPVNDGLHQCIIYDKRGPGAKILGIEYIITDDVYRTLPDAEKKYYHPHTYEITSGLLIAPGREPEAEDKILGGLITTWGKTWHTWPDPSTPLPMGEPLLMWAATRDGMIPDKALADRDARFGVNTAAIRKRRAPLGAVPQIDPPKSIDEIGRQFTNEGPDVRPK